ncbi:hypothetical protein [Amycolatopsis minnesotensis]|uniref:Uncharacterized protein n=1 Tax=Amycolatopsis minnesotensis TaxID=337894 RepID=A0ABP5BCW1_9PSEU
MSAYDSTELGLIDHVVHPHSGDQIAWFETNSREGYWVMRAYAGEMTPDIVEYDCREDAEKDFRETVDSWPVS